VRIFFVLLLLANAGLFAWQYQARGGLADRDDTLEDFQPVDPGVTPLMLLGERPASSAPAPAPMTGAETRPLAAAAVAEAGALHDDAAGTDVPGGITEAEQLIEAAPEAEAGGGQAPVQHPEPVAQAASATVRHCYEFGPSADRAAIEQVAAAAHQAGARTSTRESAPAGAGGYSVRLPGFFSLPEARARYSELKRMGVDDIAIVPLPDKRYFISLGVYKRKDTVEERRNEILAKGVTPVVEERTPPPLYTLAVEYEAADSTQLQALQRVLSARVPHIALQEVACR